jgi:uncharacterized membrane protein YczE
MKMRQLKAAWAWLFYGLVILLFPYSVAVIAGLGVADTFVDIRAKGLIQNGEK